VADVGFMPWSWNPVAGWFVAGTPAGQDSAWDRFKEALLRALAAWAS
jgi:hypothetical protein